MRAVRHTQTQYKQHLSVNKLVLIRFRLREDRRHITDRDVRILRQTLDTRMNLEMAVTEEMVKDLNAKTKPHFWCRKTPGSDH